MRDPDYRRSFMSTTNHHRLCSQIRLLRKQRGWTQADLAERLGTTASVVSRIENPGYFGISLSMLHRLADAFDIALLVQFVTFARHRRETQPDGSPLTVRSYGKPAP